MNSFVRTRGVPERCVCPSSPSAGLACRDAMASWPRASALPQDSSLSGQFKKHSWGREGVQHRATGKPCWPPCSPAHIQGTGGSCVWMTGPASPGTNSRELTLLHAPAELQGSRHNRTWPVKGNRGGHTPASQLGCVILPSAVSLFWTNLRGKV